MPEFKVETEIRDHPRVVIIRTHGYINDDAGEKVKKVILSLIEKGEKRYLVDLGGSPVINSTGIACFLEVSEEIVFSLQGKIGFCRPSKAIQEVFRMMGISMAYPVYETEEKGLAELAK